ncbi:MAG: DUF3999 family protein [Candidatus Eremiobacteraeota bacterium]|nr:DUF3999 family protein [Candidatus Eremiobacteraeota bacterium]
MIRFTKRLWNPDLRIFDDHNTETPYVLDPEPRRTPSIGVIVSDIGFVPGAYTEALIDTGSSGVLHDALAIHSPKGTYFSKVQLALSDDRHIWRITRNDALIYRVGSDEGRGNDVVTFAPSRARWLRIRIYDPRGPFPIEGAALPDDNAPTVQLTPFAGRTAVAQDLPNHETRFVTDLRANHLGISSIVFQARQRAFNRSLRVDYSDDAQTWQSTGGGEIWRYAHGEPQLDITLSQAFARYWRVTVENANDAPVDGLRMTLLGPQRVVIFRAQPQRMYRLLWDANVSPPAYDLVQQLQHDDWHGEAIGHLSLGQASTSVERKDFLQQWSAHQPIIMTVAFVVSIGGIGMLTLQTLRRTTQ